MENRKSALRSPQVFPELPPVSSTPHSYSDAETLAEEHETSSVSTAALVAARPRVVNELLLKLVDINSGIEGKLKAYERQIHAYEDRIKELEELNKPPVEYMAQSIYQPTSLSIPDDEKIILAKWPLIEEKLGLIWSTSSLLLLLFLGYTWVDVSGLGADFENEKGWIRKFMEDHGDSGLYINQMMLTLCVVFDLISIMIWALRHQKVFVYGDFKELHDSTSILSMVFLGLHFLWFQWRGGWLLLATAPLFCMLTLAAIGIHLFSMFSAKINKIHCFRGDIRYIKHSPE